MMVNRCFKIIAVPHSTLALMTLFQNYTSAYVFWPDCLVFPVTPKHFRHLFSPIILALSPECRQQKWFCYKKKSTCGIACTVNPFSAVDTGNGSVRSYLGNWVHSTVESQIQRDRQWTEIKKSWKTISNKNDKKRQNSHRYLLSVFFVLVLILFFFLFLIKLCLYFFFLSVLVFFIIIIIWWW